MRTTIHLQCTGCKRKNYSTTRNSRKQGEKLQISKFCRFCRSHKAHKEVK